METIRRKLRMKDPVSKVSVDKDWLNYAKGGGMVRFWEIFRNAEGEILFKSVVSL